MTETADWGAFTASAGLTRYIGSIVVSGTFAGATAYLDVTLTAYERAVIVMCPGVSPNVVQTVEVFASPAGAPVSFYNQIVGGNQPVIAYANPDLSAVWRAQAYVSDPANGTYTYYVFADSGLPMTTIVNNGVPIPVGGLSGATLPVLLAHDPLPVTSPPIVPYGSLVSLVGSGAHATVTFPAVSGLRYTLLCADFSEVALLPTIAPNTYFYVRDGASGTGAVLWARNVGLPNTAGASVSAFVTPNLIGSVGHAMTVETDGAVSGFGQSVSASVMLT